MAHSGGHTRRELELASRLKATISAFQAEQPKVSSEEIQRALEAARPGAGSKAREAILAVSIIAAVIGGFVGVAAQLSENRNGPVPALVYVIVGLSAAVVVVAALALRNRD